MAVSTRICFCWSVSWRCIRIVPSFIFLGANGMKIDYVDSVQPIRRLWRLYIWSYFVFTQLRFVLFSEFLSWKLQWNVIYYFITAPTAKILKCKLTRPQIKVVMYLYIQNIGLWSALLFTGYVPFAPFVLTPPKARQTSWMWYVA